MNDQQLDCKGLSCPMPIVRISQALRELAMDDVLRVEADDPAFKIDLEAWATMTGNQILSFEDGEVKIARLRRAA